MKNIHINKPVGLKEPCEEVENICRNAKVYKFGGQLKHIILPMDPGTGRSTFIEYLTNMFQKYDVLDFSCSRDKFVEVRVDASSPRHIQEAFNLIELSADYANEYSNVVGIDISDMANYISQVQMKEYLRKVEELCKTAFVVFFVHANTTKNEEVLISKTIEAVGSDKIKRLVVSAYTMEDICDLVVKIIADWGADVIRSSEFDAMLLNLVSEFCLTSVKDALNIAHELIHYANFDSEIPIVNEISLSVMVDNWNNRERSERK